MNPKTSNLIIESILKYWFSNQYSSAVARAMFTAALRAKR
jgi:hypothetical protein